MGLSGGRKYSVLQASRVRELRHGGGRPYDLDTCGRLGRRDERGRCVLQYIRRSLVSAPAGHHRASRWRWSAAVGGNKKFCNVWMELERVVTFIRAQN